MINFPDANKVPDVPQNIPVLGLIVTKDGDCDWLTVNHVCFSISLMDVQNSPYGIVVILKEFKEEKTKIITKTCSTLRFIQSLWKDCFVHILLCFYFLGGVYL